MDEFEIIFGKKYKKCKENQIRNPLTRRCINKDNKMVKYLKNQKGHPKSLIKYVKNRKIKKLKSPDIKTNKIAKFVPKLSPILETSYISSSIKDMDKRIRIYNKIIKKLKDKKEIDIKNDFIIKNDKSYLKEAPDYEIKIIINKANKYYKLVSDIVLNNRCPHFPILYGIFDKLILTEFTDGNLTTFLKHMDKTDNIYLNTLTQMIISLIFFYKETNSFHNNSFLDNFTYHKIKKGGYFHYKIGGKDYYLENVGYLWLLNNYDRCIDFNKSKEKKIRLNLDFEKIIYYFLPSNYNGIIKEMNYKLNRQSFNKIMKLLHIIIYNNDYYDELGMKIFISKLLNQLIKSKLLKNIINL